MSTQDDLNAFDQQMDADFQKVDIAHAGPYADEVKSLLALSGQADSDGTVAVIAADDYSKLISLVEGASASNLSQAELKDRIVALGATAVSIAKNVQGLAGILAAV
jgi:hypothetical protein